MKKSYTGKSTHIQPQTGFVIPLGAIVTDEAKAIGDFSDLEQLVPLCKKTGMSIIQLLPVNDTGTQSSPYSSLSAFALHPIYIHIASIPEFKTYYKKNTQFAQKYDTLVNITNPTCRFHYQQILTIKNELLAELFEQTDIAKKNNIPQELAQWIQDNPWIISYAVFKQLKWKYMQASWKTWQKQDANISPEEIQNRWDSDEHKKEYLFYAWEQYHAHTQFKQAADTIKANGIILKGDIPIMMNEDSCDAWSEPTLFNHTLRAGSPPDGENPSGQTWGFPIYKWDKMKRDGYSWWKHRLISASQYYGAYRLDHILGFFRIWAVPETDTTAYLGHAEPYVGITKEVLHNAGFDDGRINWLSKPHIPTYSVEEITHNHDSTIAILSKLCDRIGNEELWIFKKKIHGIQSILKECPEELQEFFCNKWNDRCLIEVKKDTYVPSWCYGNTSSWKSLYPNEQDTLCHLFADNRNKQEVLWQDHAFDILSKLTKSVPMQPCGEDLGVSLSGVPKVLNDTGILGLRVVRWNRIWEEPGQPFIPFENYTPLSLTTTSVHDSTTIRQWWNNEKDGVIHFIAAFDAEVKTTQNVEGIYKQATQIANTSFTPQLAKKILMCSAHTASVWYVNPLQDYLFMEKKYWRKHEEDERINIPGTVTEFNWTYRLPATIESILKNNKLIDNMRDIVKCHDQRGE